MLDKMRIDHGHPGKLPTLLDRIEKMTLPISDRFGIRLSAF